MAVHRNYYNASGYYHFGARYYDPSLGRWTQQDPVAGSLGDLGSADRYAYANDDPVNLVDPTGRCAGIQGENLDSSGTGFVFLNECTVQLIESLLWIGVGADVLAAVIVGAIFGILATIGLDIAVGILTIGAGTLQGIDGEGGNQGIMIFFYDWHYQGVSSQ